MQISVFLFWSRKYIHIRENSVEILWEINVILHNIKDIVTWIEELNGRLETIEAKSTSMLEAIINKLETKSIPEPESK